MTRSQSWRDLRRHVRQERLELPDKREGTGAVAWLVAFCLFGSGVICGLGWARYHEPVWRVEFDAVHSEVTFYRCASDAWDADCTDEYTYSLDEKQGG